MICILSPLDPFPPVESATPDGFLAIGGGLSPARLLDAYCRGIFPWGTLEGQPLWYAPDPRMVLFPEEFKVSRSLARTLRSGRFDIRFDTDFAGVVAGCAHTPRPGQGGTWITPEMTPMEDSTNLVGPTRSKPTAKAAWSAACTDWRSGECSTANRCSPGVAMLPRLPSQFSFIIFGNRVHA